jgi:hypothetical protein
MLNRSYKYFIKKYVVVKSQNIKTLVISGDEMIHRIQKQQKRMPDYLGFGIKSVVLLFVFKYFFKRVLLIRKNFEEEINNARDSYFKIFQNLIRFHDSIFEVANNNEDRIQNKKDSKNFKLEREFDFVIIGSGPGGAVSAKELQEAGFNTCILERGRTYNDNEIPPFSYNEMLNQYKHAGITTTLGNANITYVEGATVGGGSEINSGLYHRTPAEILNIWREEYALIDSDSKKLDKYFKTVENALHVSYFPEGQIPNASLILEAGANKIDWDVMEVPRWFKYDQNKTGSGQKMTITKTYLKDYLDNGGRIYELAKVKNLKKQSGRWNVYFNTDNGKKKITSKNIILSAGTIGTAQILKQSRLSKKAGRKFQMHPTIKVIAVFDEKINIEDMGVPVHQVKEFGPEISLGCSISSKPYLRIAMLDHFEHVHIVEEKWRNMAIYYAMIIPEGEGSIHSIPFFNDPLVKYNLTKRDKKNLAIGLKKLCELLLASGAIKLFPSIRKGPIISKVKDLENLPYSVDLQETSLMTVHMFSSCPIGENKEKCVADSFGKVYGQEGLFISDGSMLPSAPGVNPQGSIMAFAHRNIEKIITEA